MSNFDLARLNHLAESAIENRLSPEEMSELETLVQKDETARNFYVDYLVNHAALSLHGKEDHVDAEELRLLFNLEPASPSSCRANCQQEYGTKKSRRRITVRTIPVVLLVLSAILIPLALFAWRGASLAEAPFAAIVRTTNCSWSDSATKTLPGTRLGSCRLSLLEGIALINFDCGATVSLEGPCDFEIKTPKHTMLHSGRLVTEIHSPEAHGFLVETKSGIVKDLGTKFGVHVAEDRPANVYVMEGQVEVFGPASKQPVLLGKGESFLMTETPEPNADYLRNKIEIAISSAQGRGREAWVVKAPHTLQLSKREFPSGIERPYMLVKTTFEDIANRKAIFSIDLESLSSEPGSSFNEVSLYLSYGPTEMGYASELPDSHFTVYGLTDEILDDWNESELDWNTFPGNAEGGRLDTKIWEPVGTFVIKRGVRTGTVSVTGNRLRDFIRRDTNALATFAIVRDTLAVEASGLVHGFANRHHPTLMPPKLVFTFGESSIDESSIDTSSNPLKNKD